MNDFGDTQHPRRPRGRPKDESKRTALLDAARTLLLTKGPDVSMGEIAAAAHVAKATVYANFSDKGALIEEVVRRESDLTITDAQYLAIRDKPIEQALQTFGRNFLTFVNSKDLFAWDSLFAYIAARDAKVTKRFFDLGPGRGQRLLEELIAAAAARGELIAADSHEAADVLAGLWLGFTNLEIKLGMRPQLSDKEMIERVARGIQTFMLVYGIREGGCR